jgi:hypothetical protein
VFGQVVVLNVELVSGYLGAVEIGVVRLAEPIVYRVPFALCDERNFLVESDLSVVIDVS